MHESSLAKRLLEAVVERAGAEGAEQVTSVHGWVADAEALTTEALQFHFNAHAKGTIAETATLELKLVHLEARCNACGEVFAPDHVVICPSCDSVDCEVLGTPGLGVDEIAIR